MRLPPDPKPVPLVDGVPVIGLGHLLRPEHHALVWARRPEHAYFSNQVPESFTRLLRFLARDKGASQELSTRVAVDTQTAQEVTQNGAIKITPLRNPKLKGVAVIYVGETYRDASYKLRVVNQITAFSNRGDATTHLEKGSMVAVSVMPSLGVESPGE